jgi:hypothetical protein
VAAGKFTCSARTATSFGLLIPADEERRREGAAFRAYLDEYKCDLLKLISSKAISKLAHEPLAPWLCYHYPLCFDEKEMDARGISSLAHWEKASFFWHTLDAAHCTKAFLSHFATLSRQGKVDYFRRYDLGPDWLHRKDWFQLAFDEDATGVGEAEYEWAYAELFE